MRQYKFRGKNILNEHWHYGSLRVSKKGECFISSYGENSEFDEVRVERETVGQMVEILASQKMELFEGDVIEVKGATENEHDFKGIVYFDDGTFCLKAINQSESAKTRGYTDLIRFWKDGCHDHHSLEMICDGYCDVKVLGNIHVDVF